MDKFELFIFTKNKNHKLGHTFLLNYMTEVEVVFDLYAPGSGR